ncbi:MAG: 2Fe-2S iron-sulfur cluster binding domain-containing protein [Clostridia bacterium]|nr:2Fe-2S iron-sulfur cluster binding domain-containing protein [Clostridia bacterium]
MHKVIINGETKYAKDGTLLSDLLIKSGKGVDHHCGGRGTCRKCVITVNGKGELSCQYIIKSDFFRFVYRKYDV